MKKITQPAVIGLILLLVTGMMTNLSAKSDTEKIVIEKSFKVNSNAELVIDHEFGELECKNWDKNEISVKIIARIESNNEDRINKALSRIKYSLRGTDERVELTCGLNSKGSYNKTGISIDIEIMMPGNVRLNVKHKFGKGYIEEADGVSKIVSEYGSMTIGRLNSPESKVKISFGDGKLSYFGGGSIQISYSKFMLGETEKVTIDSEYSDISIDAAQKISLKAEGGDVKIGMVDRISGSSEFGSLKIDELSTFLEMDTEYGSLVVRNVHKDFSEIIVHNGFGSTKLFIDENATYTIEAEAEFGSINYPESLANFTYREKTMSKIKYKGVIGNDTPASSSVKLKSEYGNIQLIAN